MLPQAGSPKTVIIATGDHAVRERFSAALQGAGHAAVGLDSRDGLLDYVQDSADSADLLILDLRLDAGGVEMAQRVRHLAPGASIAVLSGSVGGAADARALSALGIDAYVNEHSAAQRILPALAPELFPDSFNRRTSTRVTLAIPVAYRFGDTIATALSLNLSRGGLGIRTMTPQDAGTKVHVRFRLPDVPFDVEALTRVAWRDQRAGMGVQFEEVAAPAQTALDGFVDGQIFAL